MTKPLSKLMSGDSGCIQFIGRSAVTFLMMEMGMTVGQDVTMVLRAPFGGPVIIKVMGTLYAVRLKDIETLIVEV